GKIDMLGEVEWRDANDILKTSPETQTTGPYELWQFTLNFNSSVKPFTDVRVRRALFMAIDEPAIAQGFHKGNSSIVVTGMHPPDSVLVPSLNERPATTRDMYKLSLEKAKKLMKEAGYPKGFKTEINITSSNEPMASLVKAYWSQIGVDAKIVVHEAAKYTRQLYGFKFNTWVSRWGFSWGNWSWVYQPGAHWNWTRINDPELSAIINETTMNYVDWDKWVKGWRAINTRVVDQGHEHQLPGPHVHTMWKPWLKNYHGELYLGRTGYNLYPTYIWLDGKK
ncbi:MAG: hypothetical protein JRD68_10340, partial [Deltaproteobacteria bacterium]|nr:hypothetical protein [Deltaproteobacteria bacterium]